MFLVSGLWHGASWNFVFWGIMHGIFMIITRCFKHLFEKIHPALNWLITFSFVNAAWVFFRVSSIRDGFRMINQVAKMNFGPIDAKLIEIFDITGIIELVENVVSFEIAGTYPYLGVFIALVGVLVLILGLKNAKECMMNFKPTISRLAITIVLIVWCVLSFADVSPFLYYNF